MSSITRIRRAAVAAALVAVPIVTIPQASATPPDPDHKVTICHVTNSATNPYIVITVDLSAFDGEGRNDHTRHVSKDGRTDELAVDGECGDTPVP